MFTPFRIEMITLCHFFFGFSCKSKIVQMALETTVVKYEAFCCFDQIVKCKY